MILTKLMKTRVNKDTLLMLLGYTLTLQLPLFHMTYGPTHLSWCSNIMTSRMRVKGPMTDSTVVHTVIELFGWLGSVWEGERGVGGELWLMIDCVCFDKEVTKFSVTWSQITQYRFKGKYLRFYSLIALTVCELFFMAYNGKNITLVIH